MSYSQLSQTEAEKIDQLQKGGVEPKKIIKQIQRARSKRGGSGPSPATVYRFLQGKTHKRGRSETRGRAAKLPANLVRVANEVRVKLIKKADSEYKVTWSDVRAETKNVLRARGAVSRSRPMPSEDWMARAVRATTPVRSRPGKRRISHASEHQKKRFEKAVLWAKYPSSWWTKGVHAYLDSKRFVKAGSAKEKKLLRATKVTHHLRTPAEGMQSGFVLPKKDHMLLGIPSIHITAAVAQDRIVLWHESKKWNGETAATMYEALGASLRARYGSKRAYHVVEDGDSAGFQSGKGKAAKKKEKLVSWLLPPRTPSWQPLDYSLWAEIERRALSKRGRDNESASDYAKRLRLTALRLPPSVIKSCLSKMKGNIDKMVASEGGHTELD